MKCGSFVTVFVFVISIGCHGYVKYQDRVKAQRALETEVESPGSRAPQEAVTKPDASTVAAFKCDGRIYCSQMTSCAEAKFFLKNCPGTKMDGDNDGIPCESQWCK
jgi:hypothetical protein